MRAVKNILGVYSDLPDIMKVTQFSEALDGRCFDDLAVVLTGHGLQDRFGVILLHSHFPVYDDEVMVEDMDLRAREITIKAVMVEDMDLRAREITIKAVRVQKIANAAASAWRFSDGCAFPMQYSTSETEGVENEMTGDDKACFSDVAAVLAKHDSARRFGLGRIDMPFQMENHEYLLEHTSVKDRMQFICVANESDDVTSVETVWHLTLKNEIGGGVTDVQAGRSCETQRSCSRSCKTKQRCKSKPKIPQMDPEHDSWDAHVKAIHDVSKTHVQYR